MSIFLRLGLSLFLALAMLSTGGQASAAPLKVVATFSILADITTQIAGERAVVTALVAPDADAHLFQPSPKDVARLKDADLVVANGLGFEGWLNRLITSSGYKGPVVYASKDVSPLKIPGGKIARIDPHAWNIPQNGLLYAKAISEALIAVDPQGQPYYAARLASYAQTLKAIDAKAAADFAAIPDAARRVITTHDAFGYLGHAYRIEFLAPLGVSTEAEPSAADVARIIKLMRREHLKAVFLENISNPKLIEQIAKEGGSSLGGTLFSDALSKADGEAPSYEALLRHNIETLLEGLRLNTQP